MAVEFSAIASSSDGNSIYIGTDNTKILIDAGLSGKKIQQGLDVLHLNGEDIDAIFVTHEHTDHIKGIGVLSRRFNIPIYATEGTWNSMYNNIGAIPERNIKFVYKDENCIVNDISVLPFEIPHDASEPVGYSIYTHKHKVSVATDIGHITETILENIKDSNILLLESNHDIQMLKNGSYPYLLKERILGKNGHLSNEIAGKVIACIMNEKLGHVFLGHLSIENNTPSVAYNTVKEILNEYGINIGTYLKLYLAPRYGVNNYIKLS